MVVIIYFNSFIVLNIAFWLGLEKMHALTIEPKKMIVELWYNEESANAWYEGFAVGDSSTYYRLSVGTFLGGTAGDSFSYHSGKMFSTFD